MCIGIRKCVYIYIYIYIYIYTHTYTWHCDPYPRLDRVEERFGQLITLRHTCCWLIIQYMCSLRGFAVQSIDHRLLVRRRVYRVHRGAYCANDLIQLLSASKRGVLHLSAYISLRKLVCHCASACVPLRQP